MNQMPETSEIIKFESDDADKIMALALVEHLFHQGKISELVYRNIRKETLKKISLAYREYL